MLLVFCFGIVHKTFSASDFIEDFTSPQYKTSGYWTEYLNGGIIDQYNSIIALSSTNPTGFPLLVGDLSSVVTDSSVYEISFRYYSFSVTQGAGVVFSHNIPGNGDIVNLPFVQTNMAVWIWPRLNGELMVNTNFCNELVIQCNNDIWTITTIPNDQMYHIFRLERNLFQYRVYLDGNLILTTQANSGKDIRYVWFGNPEVTNTGQVWPSFEIDYVKINGASTPTGTPTPTETPTPTPIPTPSPTPTPTPEPTPEPLKPVVLIPGLGASWDLGAILSANDGTAWRIPDFVHVYDNLITSLEKAGYEQGENLFVFAYDWRRNINNLGNDLNQFIQGLITSGKIKSDDKINIVGHSMGGLVARAYGQSIGTDKVNKIVTAGSPHQGAVNTYGLWEGGEIWGWPWWQRAVMELIIQLNKQQGEANVDTIRRIAPSVKDLLPLWDYLKNSNNQPISEAGLLQRNTNLALLNQNKGLIDEKLFAWKGVGVQTREFLRITQRNWLEKLEGKWEDGRPVEPLFSNEGDGTVMGVSAWGGFSHIGSTETDHLGTISAKGSVEKILEELSLDKNLAEENVTPDNRDKVLVVALRSPGKLKVCQESVCDGQLGIIYPQDKVFFLPGYNDESLSVEVIENGDGFGNYDLYLGRLGENLSDWQKIGGKIDETGEIDDYTLRVSANLLEVERDQDQLLEQVGIGFSNMDNVLPGWDKFKSKQIILDQGQKNDRRIRQIELLRLELSKIIVQSQKQKQPQRTEAAIDLWRSIDSLMELLLAGKNTISQKQYKLAESVAITYQKLISKQLEKTNNRYAGVLYRMADDLIKRAKISSLTERNLAVDQLLSAGTLLTTAVLIK